MYESAKKIFFQKHKKDEGPYFSREIEVGGQYDKLISFSYENNPKCTSEILRYLMSLEEYSS